MNEIELNAILYYADYMSLREIGQPVTDNCKYFFVHGAPINAAFILNLEPEYDKTNPYILRATTEYSLIKDKFGEDGVESFIDEICNIKAAGSVNAEQMLKYIHRWSNKYERKLAFNAYK